MYRICINKIKDGLIRGEYNMDMREMGFLFVVSGDIKMSYRYKF